ncbi:MAG TPA: YIP1 family protein [Verrucomicrobiae bacterium]|nr:YIP1 family protein [Verrucomicrobiae bacterium]
MESQETASAPQGQSEQEASSLGSRLMNVFASPGEVFDELRRRPGTPTNWLVPVALAIVVGVVFCFVIFSQPNIQQQIRDAQEKALSQKVQEHKMSQDDMDKAMAGFEKIVVPIMKIGGSVGAIFITFVRLFWWGLVVWLLGRWALRVPFPYMKGVEAVGLTMMISVLGGLVSLLMIVSMGRINAGPTLAVTIDHFDVANKSHVALAAANLFNFWFVGVIALGLAKLTNTSYGKAAVWTFGCWLAWEALLIATGLGQMAM